MAMTFRTDLPENSGAKNYLKLKDKESVEGIFRGKFHERFVIWKDRKPIDVAEGTPGASFRFRVNFVVKDGPAYTAKVFEQGVTVYKTLAELNKEYDLDEIVCKITRNGEGTDTEYSVLPLLKKTLTKEILAHLETLELQDLSGKKQTDAFGDEIPF